MGTVETVWVLLMQYGFPYCWPGSMGTAEAVWVPGTAGQAVWVLPRQYSVVSRFPDRPHYSSRATVITHTLLWVTAQEVKNLLETHLLADEVKNLLETHLLADSV